MARLRIDENLRILMFRLEFLEIAQLIIPVDIETIAHYKSDACGLLKEVVYNFLECTIHKQLR